ncbi:MAG: (5-formylfuran-3-yl)methyl phosphate synthase [Solirubrobacterales bacterium]|nr:(5-formylfuran-3-yl)methyl phosphate synthase [Solirubrobacterales bacterium]
MRLLVSVVSAEEAGHALAGAADIIDVKDPREGPLGAPAPRVLSEVVRVVGATAPVSVALGDLPALPHTAALAARGAAFSGARYVKVGLRHVHELDLAVEMMRAVADAVGPQTGVIAVAYADAQELEPAAIAPAELPELVERTAIAGALIDTFVKDGRGLFAWSSESELGRLIARTRRAGAIFAVAGQLRRGELHRVPADVVGVRSAVCRGGDRTAELDVELVAAAAAEVHGGGASQAGTIRVPPARPPGRRTSTVTPVRRTASGR